MDQALCQQGLGSCNRLLDSGCGAGDRTPTIDCLRSYGRPTEPDEQAHIHPSKRTNYKAIAGEKGLKRRVEQGEKQVSQGNTPEISAPRKDHKKHKDLNQQKR